MAAKKPYKSFSLNKALQDLNKPRGELKNLEYASALHEGQISALKPLYDKDIDIIFIAAARKFGKMLDLDTPILTPSGWVRNGDLKEGDIIYDEKGREQTILQTHPIKISPQAYRVHFDNGETIDACADHLWLTYTKNDRARDKTPTVKNTQEIFDTQMYGKEYNHSIPYTEAIKMEPKDLPIDPYVLGLWLGDGSSDDARFTTVDDELIDYIKYEGYSVTKYDYKEHYVKGLVPKLKELNLLRNKHIPTQYLLGSIEQRYALLQGLMDSDGTINDRGNSCTFDNTNKNLAEGVHQLVSSLGMKATSKERQGKLYGVEKKLCYRVFFHPLGNPVFRLKRKQNKVSSFKKRYKHHTIVMVEKIDSKPMRCISVSGDSNLYLASKSMIPTHNTELAIYAAWRYALENPGAMIYFVGPEKDHLSKIYWTSKRLPEFLGEDSSKYIRDKKDRERIIEFHNKSVILLMGSENWKAGQGHDPDLLIYDEFKAFHPKFHTEMGPNRAAKGAKLIIIGTQPKVGDRNKQEYEEIAEYCRESKNAFYMEATTWDNPICHQPRIKRIIDAEIERLRLAGKEDEVQREYYSKIVPGGSNSVFPTFKREKHVVSQDMMLKRINENPAQFSFYNVIDPAGRGIFGGIFAAMHKTTKHIFILDEIYEKDRIESTTSRMIPKILEKMKELAPTLKPQQWIKLCDEHETLYISEIYSSYGLSYGKTDKNNNKKEGGVAVIRDAFLLDRVFIADNCVNTIKEIEEYAYNEQGEIPKNHRVMDHTIDCFRYMLAAAGYTTAQVLTSIDKTPKDWNWILRGFGLFETKKEDWAYFRKKRSKYETF